MRMIVLGESDKIATEGANFKKTIGINLSGKRNQYRTLLWRVHMYATKGDLLLLAGETFR